MSINERKNPQIIETSLDSLSLSPSQLSSFSALRSSLHSLSASHDDITDFTLIRFLKAASFDAAVTQSAFLTYLSWRTTKKLDKVLDSPPFKIDVINRLVPYSYHGYDREGRPIYIEKTGKIHCAALSDESILTMDEFLDSHIWGIENLMVRAHQSSLKLGKRVETFTSLIDMQGLGFHHRGALPLLKSCLELDAKYYPEFIGKLYVLNVPWLAPYLYQAATPFVPVDVRARVHVLNDFSTLPELFAPEQLPKEYGGRCGLPECRRVAGSTEATCVIEHDASAILALVKTADDGFDKQHVASDFTRTFSCDAQGGTFTWFFECDGGFDIDFSVEISDTKGKRFAKIPSRCTTNRGSYTAKGVCAMLFKWDNTFSWMNEKDIKYAIGVVKIDVDGAEAITGGDSAA